MADRVKLPDYVQRRAALRFSLQHDILHHNTRRKMVKELKAVEAYIAQWKLDHPSRVAKVELRYKIRRKLKRSFPR